MASATPLASIGHSLASIRAESSACGTAGIMPRVVVQLGELMGVIYRSDKWNQGQPRTFIHFMDDPPRLVSNAAGTQLYIVGGRYRVTARGIEG